MPPLKGAAASERNNNEAAQPAHPVLASMIKSDVAASNNRIEAGMSPNRGREAAFTNNNSPGRLKIFKGSKTVIFGLPML
jgi:hypothetical protein